MSSLITPTVPILFQVSLLPVCCPSSHTFLRFVCSWSSTLPSVFGVHGRDYLSPQRCRYPVEHVLGDPSSACVPGLRPWCIFPGVALHLAKWWLHGSCRGFTFLSGVTFKLFVPFRYLIAVFFAFFKALLFHFLMIYRDLDVFWSCFDEHC